MPKRASQPASPLALLTKQASHPCFACSRCCTYVATQIDSPTTMTDYDHISWYLYHSGLSVYVDWEGAWYLQIETRCENLTANGLCGIYDRRPAICQDFDWRECEKQQGPDDQPPERYLFRTTEEFLAWLERRRPRAHARYLAFLERKRGERVDPALQRVARA